ncbi:MAG: TRAP transporter substrate-binding protein DctP, partial [Pseudomonadota bacterium]
YPELNIYGLPFLFDSPEEIDYVRDRFDSVLADGMKGLGYHTYGFAGGGFAYILSNEPVRGLDDLRSKKVWLPEGDLISYEAMKSLQLSPVPLPVTDVLTGLQTGLIDIVAIPPVVALALQWHTKVKYVTPIPVLYPMAFLAISDRALRRISDADKAVIDEVMRGVYSRVDAGSWAESENALNGLLSVGIESVDPVEGEVARIRMSMEKTTADMAAQGMFSQDLLNDILAAVNEFRSSDGAGVSAASGTQE